MRISIRATIIAGAVTGICMGALSLWGCAETHEHQFVAACAVGRAPMDGELMPGQGKVGDYKTSQWPWSQSHPITQYCDAAGHVTVVVENKNPSSIESLLADPISKGLSMLTLPVL
jgi:hypothetical protein